MVQQPRERIAQLHSAYFGAAYAEQYCRALGERIANRTSPLDYVAALFAALTSLSALVAVLKDQGFGWISVGLSLVTVAITTARATFDWPAKVQLCTSGAMFWSLVATRYNHLLMDVNAAKTWTPEFEKRFLRVREEEVKAPDYLHGGLPIEIRRSIQQAIIEHSGHTIWWRPA